MNVETILQKVAAGDMPVGEAAKLFGRQAKRELGFATVDTDRAKRQGVPEVILCEGKTAEQVIKIMQALIDEGQSVLATRAAPDLFNSVAQAHPSACYHEHGRIITIDCGPLPSPEGHVCVVTAGTSDIPVAEEAAITIERMGGYVTRIYDVGVAGLHRTTARIEEMREAHVVIVIAGMEGALPSVIGGLVNGPVIAVPTSVGYGLNMEGLTALLAMLNSCVAGVTVVNVDNGFGAGVAAGMINRLACRAVVS